MTAKSPSRSSFKKFCQRLWTKRIKPFFKSFWDWLEPAISFAQAYSATFTILAVATFIGISVNFPPILVVAVALFLGIIAAYFVYQYNKKDRQHKHQTDTDIKALKQEVADLKAALQVASQPPLIQSAPPAYTSPIPAGTPASSPRDLPDVKSCSLA